MKKKSFYYHSLGSIFTLVIILISLITFIFACIVEFSDGINSKDFISAGILLLIIFAMDITLILGVLKFTLVKYTFYEDLIKIKPPFGKAITLNISDISMIKKCKVPTHTLGNTNGFEILFSEEKTVKKILLVSNKKTREVVSELEIDLETTIN
ncbi:MAG: hypothetical protein PF513_01340 [Tenericutes bacterium]|jgi:hypothetical protein|nr:hypothetical protein [Mycoplasmatota bacterium]